MTVRICSLERSELSRATALLAQACKFDEASAVAEEKLFAEGAGSRIAEPLAAYEGPELVGLACTSGAWLRLLAVHREQRGRGIGSALLARCEEQIARHSQAVRVLDQPGNYLSPGIDTRNAESIDWLRRRDYVLCGENHNLLIELQSNPLVSRARLESLTTELATKGYVVERQRPERVAGDASRVEAAFSPGWAFEMRRAASFQPSGVHVAIEATSGDLAGFAAHDGNNRGLGWFGPTGTLAEHRKKGLGTALLMACLIDIAEAEHPHCQVAWIGPRDFYQRVAGIASERHFCVLKKELSHD